MLGVILPGIEAVKRKGLVADDAGGAVSGCRVDAMGIHVRLRAGHEKTAYPRQDMQPGEVEVSPIHHVDGSGLGSQQVECMRVVQLAVRDMDIARDAAAGPAACTSLPQPWASGNEPKGRPADTGVGRTRSCRCSWRPPWKYPRDCPNRLPPFKSTPHVIARNPASIMAFSDSALQLTGQH